MFTLYFTSIYYTVYGKPDRPSDKVNMNLLRESDIQTAILSLDNAGLQSLCFMSSQKGWSGLQWLWIKHVLYCILYCMIYRRVILPGWSLWSSVDSRGGCHWHWTVVGPWFEQNVASLFCFNFMKINVLPKNVNSRVEVLVYCVLLLLEYWCFNVEYFFFIYKYVTDNSSTACCGQEKRVTAWQGTY